MSSGSFYAPARKESLGDSVGFLQRVLNRAGKVATTDWFPEYLKGLRFSRLGFYLIIHLGREQNTREKGLETFKVSQCFDPGLTWHMHVE